MTPPGRRLARDHWFAARFLALYDGPCSAEDALWWYEHPGQVTPAGDSPPDARAAALRRVLFSATSTPDDFARHEAAARLAADHVRAMAEAARRAGAPAAGAPTEEQRRRRPERTARLFIGAACAALGLVVGVGVGQLRFTPTPQPSAAASSTAIGTAVPSPRLPDLASPGDELLRMSSSSPRVGGTLPESGTTAFQSNLVEAGARRVRLTITCVGGDSLLVVAGAEGLVHDDYAIVQCPQTEAATSSTFLAAADTVGPLRMVVYERQPVTWKLLLSAEPSN